jgi:hypothetical protein
MFGDGSMARDYTYIDDIVDGIIRAGRCNGFLTCNLGDPTPFRKPPDCENRWRPDENDHRSSAAASRGR